MFKTHEKVAELSFQPGCFFRKQNADSQPVQLRIRSLGRSSNIACTSCFQNPPLRMTQTFRNLPDPGVRSQAMAPAEGPVSQPSLTHTGPAGLTLQHHLGTTGGPVVPGHTALDFNLTLRTLPGNSVSPQA